MEDKPFVKEKVVVKVGESKDIELELPRLNLKKIVAVTGAIDKLIGSAKEKSPQIFDVFNKNDDNMSLGVEIVKLLPSILPVLMNEIISVLSIYLNKDKNWIEDNMDMEDLVAVATPFFGDIFKQGSHLTNALSQMLPKKEEENKETNPSLQ